MSKKKILALALIPAVIVILFFYPSIFRFLIPQSSTHSINFELKSIQNSTTIYRNSESGESSIAVILTILDEFSKPLNARFSYEWISNPPNTISVSLNPTDVTIMNTIPTTSIVTIKTNPQTLSGSYLLRIFVTIEGATQYTDISVVIM